ncbi:hypothetical protein Patl1_24556 [Pistacia atlantica]|uniref:Uncharacterized protein n=1 Tax=Pistacia atlantica TaxID=434234 RepID=A0ACC1A2L6_9ROSI|nr:hypothetical protein Patl1_24556 [Pistacia atlantica]
MVNRFLMLGRREDGFRVLLSQKKILMSRVNQFCVNLHSVNLSLVFSMEEPVGFIHEQSNVIARQHDVFASSYLVFMSARVCVICGNKGIPTWVPAKKLNSNFKALFYHIQVRRPFWWITSSIYAEINSKEIGVIHRRWHLWRRVYDLYLG